MRRLDVHMRNNEAFETVIRAIKAADPVDYFVIPLEQKDRRYVSVFLRDETGQSLMDNIQMCLEGETEWRLSLLPIEATAPRLEVDEARKTDRKVKSKQALREEIFTDI